MYTGRFYFNENQFKLIKGDTFRALKKFEDKSQVVNLLQEDMITIKKKKLYLANKSKTLWFSNYKKSMMIKKHNIYSFWYYRD